MLEKNISHNRRSDRVAPFQIAAFSKSGMATFCHDSANAGHSHLAKQDSSDLSLLDVPTERLDDFADLQKILSEGSKTIGAIKIDIEGAEHQALKGMNELLRRFDPF